MSFNLIFPIILPNLFSSDLSSLESKKFKNSYKNKLREYIMIYDSQVYTALLIAVVASVLAIRLGATLYS